MPTPRARLERAEAVASAGLLAAAWLWLYAPVLSWMAAIYPRDDFRASALALAATAGLVAWRARRWRGAVAPPAIRAPALALAVGGSAAFVASERLLDVNILGAALFGLSTYGLAGLWLAPGAWRAGWPAALLLVGTLPFGAHLQVFVGLPVRIATAEAVANALATAGVAATSADAVLTLERGVARVDLPCSGVQSLWTGGLFLLAATWIEGRRIGLRWLLAAAGAAALLLAANAGRVLALVVVGDVLGAVELARLAHVPLGVLAFAAACGGAALLLRLVPAVDAGTDAAPRGRRDDRGAARPVLALAAVVAALAVAHEPRAAARAPAAPALRWPAGLATVPDPLTPDERAWLERDGAVSAERVRFAWPTAGGDALRGSATVVASATWRAQHLPERCLEVHGLRIVGVRSHAIEPDQTVRVVALGDPTLGQAPRAALYWFQSATRLTDDYAARIAADLAPERERWVLVALLFEPGVDPASDAVRDLARALRASLAAGLAPSAQGGPS